MIPGVPVVPGVPGVPRIDRDVNITGVPLMSPGIIRISTSLGSLGSAVATVMLIFLETPLLLGNLFSYGSQLFGVFLGAMVSLGTPDTSGLLKSL